MILELLAADPPDYGALTPVVAGVVSAFAALGAIGFAWRGRANWEPAEEDLSRGPAKVGGVVSVVVLAVLWVFVGKGGSLAPLGWIAGITGLITVVSLITYGLLVNSYLYDRIVSEKPEESRTIKIVAAATFTPYAKASMAKEPDLTIQELFAGSAYDPDKIWPRSARGRMKAAFALSYIGLTVFGTTAVAATAMLLIAS